MEIAPIIVSRLVRRLEVWNLECLLVRMKEILKKELGVDHLLNPWRQLVIDVQICILSEGGKPVIVPLVLKKVFNSQL